jgi:hypothetical protein
MRAWTTVVLALVLALPVSLPIANLGGLPPCCHVLGSGCHDTGTTPALECCTPAAAPDLAIVTSVVRPPGDPRPALAVVSAVGFGLAAPPAWTRTSLAADLPPGRSGRAAARLVLRI